MNKQNALIAAFVSVSIFLHIICFFHPYISIWKAEVQGRAKLRKEHYNQETAVIQAYSKKEIAQLIAESEVIKAQGIAKANKIIGESLANQNICLRCMWMKELKKNNEDIYFESYE